MSNSMEISFWPSYTFLKVLYFETQTSMFQSVGCTKAIFSGTVVVHFSPKQANSLLYFSLGIIGKLLLGSFN